MALLNELIYLVELYQYNQTGTYSLNSPEQKIGRKEQNSGLLNNDNRYRVPPKGNQEPGIWATKIGASTCQWANKSLRWTTLPNLSNIILSYCRPGANWISWCTHSRCSLKLKWHKLCDRCNINAIYTKDQLTILTTEQVTKKAWCCEAPWAREGRHWPCQDSSVALEDTGASEGEEVGRI